MSEQVCEVVTEQVCQQVQAQACQTVPEEECTEELVEECNTVNDLRCERVEDEKCETVEEEECEDVEEEECDDEGTVCDTVETEECYTKYEEECETVYKERCSTEYELECTTGMYPYSIMSPLNVAGYCLSRPRSCWQPEPARADCPCYRLRGDLPARLRGQRPAGHLQRGREPQDGRGLPDHPRQQLQERGQAQLQADCGRAVQEGSQQGVWPRPSQEVQTGQWSLECPIVRRAICHCHHTRSHQIRLTTNKRPM